MSAEAPAPADYSGQIAQSKDMSTGLLGQAKTAWGQPMQDAGAFGRQAGDAMYQQATSRLDPQWQQREEQQSAQLASQGLDPTSQAAQSANRNLGMQRNDAYNQAGFSAQQMAGQEAQRMQGMDIQGRMAPLAAYQGLLGGQLGMQQQQYGQAANNASMQNQFWSGLLGGGMQLAGDAGKAYAGMG